MSMVITWALASLVAAPTFWARHWNDYTTSSQPTTHETFRGQGKVYDDEHLDDGVPLHLIRFCSPIVCFTLNLVAA
jgi:hypothetical protein